MALAHGSCLSRFLDCLALKGLALHPLIPQSSFQPAAISMASPPSNVQESALVMAGNEEVPESGLKVTVVPCQVCGANCAYKARVSAA